MKFARLHYARSKTTTRKRERREVNLRRRHRVTHSLLCARRAGPPLSEWLSHSSLMSDALSETGSVNRKARENNQLHCRKPAKPSFAKHSVECCSRNKTKKKKRKGPTTNRVCKNHQHEPARRAVGRFDPEGSRARGFSRRPVSESYSCASCK